MKLNSTAILSSSTQYLDLLVRLGESSKNVLPKSGEKRRLTMVKSNKITLNKSKKSSRRSSPDSQCLGLSRASPMILETHQEPLSLWQNPFPYNMQFFFVCVRAKHVPLSKPCASWAGVSGNKISRTCGSDSEWSGVSNHQPTSSGTPISDM